MALYSNGAEVVGSGTVRGSASNLTGIPAPTTSQVLSATAGLSAGAVGTHILGNLQSWQNRTFGATEAGSNIGGCHVAGGGPSSTSTQSGTWRCLGSTQGSTDASYNATVWVRIS